MVVWELDLGKVAEHLGVIDVAAFCNKSACIRLLRKPNAAIYVVAGYGPEDKAEEAFREFMRLLNEAKERREKWVKARERFKTGVATLEEVLEARSAYIDTVEEIKRRLYEDTEKFITAMEESDTEYGWFREMRARMNSRPSLL